MHLRRIGDAPGEDVRTQARPRFSVGPRPHQEVYRFPGVEEGTRDGAAYETRRTRDEDTHDFELTAKGRRVHHGIL